MAKKSNIFMTFLKSFLIFFGAAFIIFGIQELFKSETIGTLFGYLICIAILFNIYRSKIKEDMHNFKDDFKKYFPKVLIVSAILIALETLLSLILSKYGLNSTNQDVGVNLIKNSPVLMFITSGIITPIFEEMTFRLPYHYSKGNKLAIYIFYSVMFALIHLFGVGDWIGTIYIIPYLLLSFGIGYGFYKTDNIFMSTIIHIINNILAIMLILL